MNEDIPVHFDAKKMTIGTSEGVLIPKGVALILNPDKKYRFFVKEVPVDDDTKKVQDQ